MSNIGIRNVLSGTKFNSIIAKSSVNFASNPRIAATINDTIPGLRCYFYFLKTSFKMRKERMTNLLLSFVRFLEILIILHVGNDKCQIVPQ